MPSTRECAGRHLTSAIAGTSWNPAPAPAPITATRVPVRSMSSRHAPVWQEGAANSLAPLMFGITALLNWRRRR
ncbi:hypothetical protein [Mycobacterium lentiflavum]|uniref:hypothetical protein n=1 Tax=Mycobacterium lentiflavum TaxID=141349 RepID=UPI001112A631|nr:hypothetical protein [Mycobacterium lentiflavum]